MMTLLQKRVVRTKLDIYDFIVTTFHLGVIIVAGRHFPTPSIISYFSTMQSKLPPSAIFIPT
jgi:hypothetical protein